MNATRQWWQIEPIAATHSMTVQQKATTVACLVVFLSSICIVTFSQDAKWKEWEAKADTLYKQEDFKEAIKMYTKAIELSKLKDKDAYRSVYKRAVSYYSLGQFDAALKDLDLFIPQYPNVSQAKLLRAFIYRELGDDEKQLANLEEAIGSQPPNPELLKWRGLLYLQKSEYAKSKSDLTLARLLQDDPEVETYLGLAYYNLQQKDSAYMSFNKSIELDAMYTPAYLYAGSVSLEDTNYKLALQYLNLALRLEPKNKEAIFYKGIALIELERVDEGCKCLNRAFYAGMDEAAGYLKEYCYPTDN
ncbi:MAG TPA: tetratricopeptide repeat protein [Cyclobacteriaceae bacterium]|nr:tetratricopeptide repeat protein [Cyclobacteriaceae bacterium]